MSGFLYLAVVLDVFSRKIVDWSMANHLRTELIVDVLDMAVGQRCPRDVIHHSDQGCQYTSLALAVDAKKLAFDHRWDLSVTLTTTLWPRVSSRPWNAKP